MVDSKEFGMGIQKAIKKANQRELKKRDSSSRFKSKLTNPRYSGYGGLLSRQKYYSMELFRRIAEKAWLVNVIIKHIIDKTIPYLNPLANKGRRGFAIELKDPDAKMTDALKKEALEIQEFFLNTGWKEYIKEKHEDDLPTYSKKIMRDLLTLDQTAAEKLWSANHSLLAFEAIDAGSVLRCTEEGYEGDDEIQFVQMMDSQVVSQYQSWQILFQFDNPRTDLKHWGYGYSLIEQCANLVVASIQTFAYNSGAFTEDKLPRGMILLNGDMGMEEVEEIEDYLIDVMGNGIEGATKRWGIPIVPSGKGGDKSSITWQPMGNTNQEMQYSEWQEFLDMGMAAMFGVDIESTGIKNKRGAKIMESGSAEAQKYSDDKGIGNMLIFLQRHFQSYLDDINPLFKFVFHGFEQDDAKETREAISSELASFKSLNDILKENDKPESDLKFASVPGLQNPQFKELYMAEIGQGEEGGPEDEQGQDEFDQGFDEFGKSVKDNVVTIVI